MRHTILCLLIAVLGVAACFILVSIFAACLVLLFDPGFFENELIPWWVPFVIPALLTMPPVSLIVGGSIFSLAKANFPDVDWRSAPAKAILLAFTAFLATAAAVTYLQIWGK
jgi:hypothetical protein